MRIIFGIFVVVITLFALNKLPYPGAKPSSLASGPVSSANAATPAVAAKPEPPRVQYVTTRDCTRSIFGVKNCTEVTTVKR